MANRKPQPRHLGTGMARRAGEAIKKQKKKKEKRMDEIWGQIKTGR